MSGDPTRTPTRSAAVLLAGAADARFGAVTAIGGATTTAVAMVHAAPTRSADAEGTR